MKKIILLLLFLSAKSFGQQEYAVTYDYKIIDKKYGNLTEVKTYLFGNGKYSLYEEDFKHEKTSESENNFSLKSMENPIFFKDLALKKTTFKDQIRMKFFNIKDSTAVFDWKITAEKKTILGYACQKATMHFRGRNYNAYFTDKIPFQDGPWKFSGLPGMILEIKSDDSDMSFSIVAEKVELKKGTSKFENPYLGKKVISYVAFVEIYNKKYQESVANNAQDPNIPIWPKAHQEVYVEN